MWDAPSLPRRARRPLVADTEDDQAADAIAQRARLWWEHEAERALADLRLYPVQVEDMGHTTTSDPGATW